MLDCLRREVSVFFCSEVVRLSEIKTPILNHNFGGHIKGRVIGKYRENSELRTYTIRRKEILELFCCNNGEML